MGKILSLLERLNSALDITSSDTEQNAVYVLLYETGSKAPRSGCKTFYKNITYKSLIPSKEQLEQNSKEKIQKGKQLEKELRSAIILPEKNTKHHGIKYKRIRKREHKLLINFYRTGDNEKNI